MKTFFTIIQISSAILLSLSILIQSRGSGLSATFGGAGGFYHEKRGAEKIIGIATIAFTVIFLVSSFTINFL